MRTQVSFGTKLVGGFSAMLALTLILSYTSLTSLSSMKDSFDNTAGSTSKKFVLAEQISIDVSDMLAWQRGVLLYGYAKDAAKMESSKQTFDTKVDAAQKTLAEIAPLLDQQGKDSVSGMQAKIAQWQSALADGYQLCVNGKTDEAFKSLAVKAVPLYQAIGKETELLTQANMELLEGDRKNAAEQYAQSRWMTLALIGLSVAAAAIILFVVRQSNKSLRQMAFELAHGAEQVASAASQVASASQSLAQGASEQAASLEETSASSEEMSSMTRRSAENAESAAGLMVQAAQAVEQANGKLEHMVQSMNEINTSSDKISKIIKVIDEIAFQTNILALNAAVEAARAGEAGMGFAVVADEVRNLAQRSAQAAKDTAALIEESIAKSGEGRTRLDEVAKAISAMTDSSRKVKELVDEVNLGSQEQARGIEQVSRAVVQMQQVTQKTAANAEESAAASEELSAQAGTTRSVVEQLQELIGGAEGRGTAARQSRRRAAVAAGPHDNRGLASFAGAVEGGRMAGAADAAEAAHEPGEPVAVGKNAFPLEDEF
jgi:methyl-accepting chemotaxis protein